MISPHLIQQLVPTDNAIRVLHQKLEGFKFLSGQNHGLAVALHFHPLEIRGDAVEVHEDRVGSTCRVTKRGAYPGQQFPGTKRFGDIVIRA